MIQKTRVIREMKCKHCENDTFIKKELRSEHKDELGNYYFMNVFSCYECEETVLYDPPINNLTKDDK